MESKTKVINGDLILTKDFKFDGNLIVHGNIKSKDSISYNIYAYDIDAYDIQANDVYANDIYAYDIDANDIHAYDIDAHDVDANNIHAIDITANDIDAMDIVCESVKSKKRIFARSLLKNCLSIIRKDFNKKEEDK